MIASGTYPESLLLQLAQQLPTAPRLLAELGRLLRDPATANAADVVTLLRRDAGLAARVLRVANSAAYGWAEPIGAIEDAVVSVGFTEVHRLVGAVAATELADRPLELHGISAAAYRANALFTATVMEQLGSRAQLDPQACYTAGLLRSLGKVVLDRAAAREGASIASFPASGEPVVADWERQHWGVDGWSVTALVLREWHLPAEIATAIEHHASPEGRPEPAVHLLHLAAAIAARDGYGLPGEYPRADAATLAAAGLTQSQFECALERAEEIFKRLRASVV